MDSHYKDESNAITLLSGFEGKKEKAKKRKAQSEEEIARKKQMLQEEHVTKWKISLVNIYKNIKSV